MKHFLMIAWVALIVPMASRAALVDPALQNFARSNGGQARVVVLMDFRPTRALPMANPAAVRAYLQQEMRTAWSRTQPSLQSSLASRDVVVVTMHSISQSFTAVVTPAGLRTLANTPGVTKVYNDGVVQITPPVTSRPAQRRFEAIPYDLAIMGLDEVNKANPNLNGAGVFVGHIDTGVDGRHPALAGKIAIFYDSSKGQKTEPQDSDTHGTHTAGTIVGNPKDGAPMGVAPGARLISVGGLNDYDSMLKGMEFMLDPDGNPATNDVPRVVSNSWNCEGAPDLEAFYRAINAWEAAGILTVFSAGNSGPRPRTITKPHEHPLSFSVAAFGPNGVIANFSSRGPGVFNGQDVQKPDVGAPGVDIVSSVPGGGYKAMSGTSMAAPHVTGLAALLFQMDPSLTPAKVRQILTVSSNYVDDQGKEIPQMRWNPVFGFGRVNAVKAINMVKSFHNQFTNRWAAMVAPSMDVARGLNMAAVQETAAFAPTANALATTFVTDRSKWIDGRDL